MKFHLQQQQTSQKQTKWEAKALSSRCRLFPVFRSNKFAATNKTKVETISLSSLINWKYLTHISCFLYITSNESTVKLFIRYLCSCQLNSRKFPSYSLFFTCGVLVKTVQKNSRGNLNVFWSCGCVPARNSTRRHHLDQTWELSCRFAYFKKYETFI